MNDKTLGRLKELTEEYDDVVDELAATGLEDHDAGVVKERLTFVRAKNNQLIRMASDDEQEVSEEDFEEVLDDMASAVGELKEIQKNASGN